MTNEGPWGQNNEAIDALRAKERLPQQTFNELKDLTKKIISEDHVDHIEVEEFKQFMIYLKEGAELTEEQTQQLRSAVAGANDMFTGQEVDAFLEIDFKDDVVTIKYLK